MAHGWESWVKPIWKGQNNWCNAIPPPPYGTTLATFENLSLNMHQM